MGWLNSSERLPLNLNEVRELARKARDEKIEDVRILTPGASVAPGGRLSAKLLA